MILTATEILTYLKCPFKLWCTTQAPDIQSGAELSNQLINRTIKYYYYTIMGGKRAPTELQLRKKWSQLAAGTGLEDTSTRAAVLLNNFYSANGGLPIYPIAVDQTYNLKLEQFYLKGTIDFIRENQTTKHIELVVYQYQDRNLGQHYADHSLAITLQSFAYRQLFGGREKILVHHLKSGHIYHTSRSSHDYAWALRTLRGAGNNVMAGNYYPIYNEYCNQCEYCEWCTEQKGN